MDGCEAWGGGWAGGPCELKKGPPVGVRAGQPEARARARVDRPVVQILVVVAKTLARTRRADEEKGLVTTAMGHC